MDKVGPIGIAYIATSGNELGSIGGCASVETAIAEARMNLRSTYPQAIRAVVYSGRTLAEGEVLTEVTR